MGLLGRGRVVAIGLVVALISVGASWTARAASTSTDAACVETARPPADLAVFEAQRSSFGFHDEELVLCSPGHEQPTHIAARLWIPEACPAEGGCAGALVAHGFAFTKEFTVADMQNLVSRGFYVLSYDVRGHGASGGQAGLMGREEIADQAYLLRWFHEHVSPTKVGVYGISQGGAHAFMAAIWNCGSARAAAFDSEVGCDEGERWVDAIIPFQGPTHVEDDGTCSLFIPRAAVSSRAHPQVTGTSAACSLGEVGVEEEDSLPMLDLDLLDYLGRVDRIDVPVYVATSFYDRLVLPQQSTRMYEALSARAASVEEPYDEDVRIAITNDGHGAIGANFGVLDDAFSWLQWQLQGADPTGVFPRPERLVFAQEWDGDALALEADWPYWEAERSWYLTGEGGLGDNPLGEGHRSLYAVPQAANPPQAPFSDQAPSLERSDGVEPVTLTYLTPPAGEAVEVAGLPMLEVWVSSSNAAGMGRAQLHVSLAEVTPDGDVEQFARNRIGLSGLGPEPMQVALDVTVASHRVDPGNRLMLKIAPTDAADVQPPVSADELRIHHGASHPSRLVTGVADADRSLSPGPTGPTFPGDAVGAVCAGLRLPCPG